MPRTARRTKAKAPAPLDPKVIAVPYPEVQSDYESKGKLTGSLLSAIGNLEPGRSFILSTQQLEDAPLQGWIDGCGLSCEKGKYSWNGMTRSRTKQAEVAFQYTLAGEGRLRYGKKEVPILPGQLMMLVTPGNYRYWLPANSEFWMFVFVSIRGEELANFFSRLIQEFGPLVNILPQSPAVQFAFEICRRARSNRIDSFYAASELAFRLATKIGHELCHIQKEEAIPTPIKMAREFCIRNYSSKISVADMAIAAGLSLSYFTTLFEKKLGMTPRSFLEKVRIEQACRLLQNSELSVKAVAYATGFRDPNYFAKAFRRFVGIAPTSFSRQ